MKRNLMNTGTCAPPNTAAAINACAVDRGTKKALADKKFGAGYDTGGGAGSASSVEGEFS